MFAGYETALAGLLTAETGAAPGSAEPFVAAIAGRRAAAAFEAPPTAGRQPATRPPPPCTCCAPGWAATPSPPPVTPGWSYHQQVSRENG